MAAAAPPRRHKAPSVSAGAASADHFQLDNDGIPNEGVLKAIEALGYTCAVHDVVAHCGLPRDLVEAEMMALLRSSNGFFEIASASANDEIMKYQQQHHHHHHKEVEYAANVFSTDHVRYVFPPGLRSFLRRRFVLMRMREAGEKVLRMAFAILRVSFGVLLLLSLLVVVLVLVIVVARSSGGDHRHGSGLDVLRVFHRPRRHYIGGGGLGGGGDWRDMYYMWWWWNYNPFLFGLDPQIQAQRVREQHARRRRAFDALDEEEGGVPEMRAGGGGVSAGTRRMAGSSSSSSSHPLAGHEEQDRVEEQQEGGEEEGEEVEEDMTFLEALFSLLFGDGSPGPSQNQRWQAVAKLIHAQNGIVLPEEVAPLLTDVNPQKLDTSMLPVCARFGGRPV
eukprot:evm.model.NODE_16645_length_15759_cov_30.505997.6